LHLEELQRAGHTTGPINNVGTKLFPEAEYRKDSRRCCALWGKRRRWSDIKVIGTARVPG